MRNILRNTGLMVLLTLATLSAFGQKGRGKANKETVRWRYEIEAVGTGTRGSYQIKVWTYSKNEATAVEQCKKNAVHGIIFKGFPARNGVQGQKSLARSLSIYEDNKSFFESFFKSKGGEYMRFVTMSNNGNAAGDRIKIKKKEYKIGSVVSVDVASLRKYLEEQEIIKGLSSGF